MTDRLDALENPRLARLVTVGADAEVNLLLGLHNEDCDESMQDTP
jgi:hypothetical protein